MSKPLVHANRNGGGAIYGHHNPAIFFGPPLQNGSTPLFPEVKVGGFSRAELSALPIVTTAPNIPLPHTVDRSRIAGSTSNSNSSSNSTMVNNKTSSSQVPAQVPKTGGTTSSTSSGLKPQEKTGKVVEPTIFYRGGNGLLFGYGEGMVRPEQSNSFGHEGYFHGYGAPVRVGGYCAGNIIDPPSRKTRAKVMVDAQGRTSIRSGGSDSYSKPKKSSKKISKS
jgi:hypothetical protein